VGIAVMASVLTTTYQSHLRLTHLPTAEAGQARSSVAVAVHLSGAIAGQARTAFTGGLHLALLITAGIVICAAIAAAALLRGHDRASRPARPLNQ
jgi:DHA2 family multidrug resistance protein-like MFS transporter